MLSIFKVDKNLLLLTWLSTCLLCMYLRLLMIGRVGDIAPWWLVNNKRRHSREWRARLTKADDTSIIWAVDPLPLPTLMVISPFYGCYQFPVWVWITPDSSLDVVSWQPTHIVVLEFYLECNYVSRAIPVPSTHSQHEKCAPKRQSRR